MIKGRIFIIVFLFLMILAITPMFITFSQLSEDTPKSDTMYKIGVLTATKDRLTKIDGIQEGLNQFGFSQDNIEMIIKNANGDAHRLEALAEELVASEVDVIIATSGLETQAAKNATKEKEIPVVFVGVGCSVELGLVNGNISTECNITGVDSHYVQLSGKRLEYLKRLVPNTKQVLILYNPNSTPFGPSSKFLYEAADKLNITLDLVPVVNKEEVLQALNEKSENVDGIMLMCSLLFESMTDSIVEIALDKKLPVMGIIDRQVEAGILAFYGSTSYSEGKQSARIVANILKGQDPRVIPIEAPDKLELHVNIDTAKKLDINIEPGQMPFVDQFVREKGDLNGKTN